jgi:large subunit ribosomal protein L6
MSRVGRSPVQLPKGVSTSLEQGVLTVKGPKGTLSQKIKPGFELTTEGTTLTFRRPDDSKTNKALHGLYAALLKNMVRGVSTGYELVLEFVGVGYKVEAKGQVLDLALGFSHGTIFYLPKEIKAEVEMVKGQNPKLKLSGIDKQLLGQVAAKIRSIRPPEPYKGKGIRFEGEAVRRKAGKASGKGKK